MTQEMLEFVEALDRQGARSLVIGGCALAFLGVPRYTKDLDLWVNAREAVQLLEAIRDFFGGDDLGLTVEDLSTSGVVQLGYEPNRIERTSRGLMPAARFILLKGLRCGWFPARTLYGSNGVLGAALACATSRASNHEACSPQVSL